MVPTRTGNQGKPGKWEAFLSQGKVKILGKLAKKLYWKIEKKYWKSQGNLSASNSENPANMVPYFK